MTSVMLALAVLLALPAQIRSLPDTVKARRPPALAPAGEAGKPRATSPNVIRGKPASPPKGKPVGEPQLKRRKPPKLDWAQIR